VLQVERLAQWTLPGSRGQSEIAIVSRGELLYATSGINPTGSGFITDKQTQIELALDGEFNQFSYTGPNGTDRIAVAMPLGYEGVDWVIIVTQPDPSIFQGLSTPEVLIVFALAVTVITAMAVVLGELTARPLRTLAAQAQALHQGRLRGPVVAQGSGEIRSLGLHFAEMAHQMNAQVAVLEEGRHDRERQAEQMRDLLRRTNRLQEDERRRIASDIHDAVSPLITGALYQTRALQMTNGAHPTSTISASSPRSRPMRRPFSAPVFPAVWKWLANLLASLRKCALASIASSRNRSTTSFATRGPTRQWYGSTPLMTCCG
jgi:HAMP domain-containing protein